MIVDAHLRQELISDEEKKILDLLRQGKVMKHAEIVIQIQDAKAVSAQVRKKVKL